MDAMPVNSCFFFFFYVSSITEGFQMNTKKLVLDIIFCSSSKNFLKFIQSCLTLTILNIATEGSKLTLIVLVTTLLSK